MSLPPPPGDEVGSDGADPWDAHSGDAPSGDAHPTEVVAEPQQAETQILQPDPESAPGPVPTGHPSIHPTAVQLSPVPAAAAAGGAVQYPPDGPARQWVNPRMRPSAFADVRARWLIAFAVVGTLLLVAVEALLGAVLGVNLLSSELLAGLFYLPLVVWAFFVQWRNRVRLKLLFARPRLGSYWWVVVGMVLALLVFSLGASAVTAALVPDYVAGAEIDVGSNTVALVLTIAVIPPVVEELIFRGLLLERWAAKWRIGTAVVVQAVFFGILHVDPVGAGVFGVAMALMYLRTRTLWVPIIMHAMNNGLVLVAVLLGGDAAQDTGAAADAGETGLQILAGLLIMAAAAPFVVLFIKRNWPGADQLTPYEEAELGGNALPPRRLGKVMVGAVQYRASLTPPGLLVSVDRAGRSPQWAIPYRDVSHLAITPDWRHMLLMGPGGQLQLDFGQSGERVRTRTMHAIAQRVTAESGTPATWWR